LNDPTDEEAFKLLFVCTGNTCRSPMAEAIARSRLAELGWDRVDVSSAGIAARSGSHASEGAIRAAQAHGLDLSHHRSTLLTQDIAAEADLILAMSPSHIMRVLELGAGDRSALLTSYAGGVGIGIDASIPDPIGGTDEEYLDTFRTLKELIERALERLQPVLAE
jgi:protein-tyrosine-phosphatase